PEYIVGSPPGVVFAQATAAPNGSAVAPTPMPTAMPAQPAPVYSTPGYAPHGPAMAQMPPMVYQPYPVYMAGPEYCGTRRRGVLGRICDWLTGGSGNTAFCCPVTTPYIPPLYTQFPCAEPQLGCGDCGYCESCGKITRWTGLG